MHKKSGFPPTRQPRTAAQLDAEIAETLCSPAQGRAKLRPVEGVRISADSRGELNRFWRAHPALRKGCVRKYGFDPVDQEADYWRFGLAEPDHASLLSAVRRNDDVFSRALVKRWKAQELRHAKK